MDKSIEEMARELLRQALGVRPDSVTGALLLDASIPQLGVVGTDAAIRAIIAALSAPKQVDGDWYTDPDTGTHVLDLDDNPNQQVSIMLKPDGSATFAAYLDGEKIVGAVTDDFRDVVLRWAAPQPVEAEGPEAEDGDPISTLEAYARGVNDGRNGKHGQSIDGGRNLAVDALIAAANNVEREAWGKGVANISIEAIKRLTQALTDSRLTTQQPEQPAIDLVVLTEVFKQAQSAEFSRLEPITRPDSPGRMQANMDSATTVALRAVLAIIDGAKGERGPGQRRVGDPGYRVGIDPLPGEGR